jgi:lysophospholipase L1-like esterase
MTESSPTPSDPSADRAPQRRRTLAALVLLGLFAAVPILMSPAGRGAGAAIDRCGIPDDLSALGAPLPRVTARLAAGQPVTIVALGSSSTEGIGASGPDRTYPSRLAALLRTQFPGVAIRVVNRGVGGEIAPQMLARLDRDVLAEQPDLVIWQLGTNSVLHDLDPADEVEFARAGIERIHAAGADVMLMDLQYAPAVLLHPGYREMLHVLSAVARTEDVALFRRFAVMRHWAEDGQMTLAAMLANDRLHMSDVSYDCLARQVERSIVAAVPAQPSLAQR